MSKTDDLIKLAVTFEKKVAQEYSGFPKTMNAPAEREPIGRCVNADLLSELTYFLWYRLQGVLEKSPKNTHEGPDVLTHAEFEVLVKNLKEKMPEFQKGWAALNKLVALPFQ